MTRIVSLLVAGALAWHALPLSAFAATVDASTLRAPAAAKDSPDTDGHIRDALVARTHPPSPETPPLGGEEVEVRVLLRSRADKATAKQNMPLLSTKRVAQAALIGFVLNFTAQVAHASFGAASEEPLRALAWAGTVWPWFVGGVVGAGVAITKATARRYGPTLLFWGLTGVIVAGCFVVLPMWLAHWIQPDTGSLALVIAVSPWVGLAAVWVVYRVAIWGLRVLALSIWDPRYYRVEKAPAFLRAARAVAEFGLQHRVGFDLWLGPGLIHWSRGRIPYVHDRDVRYVDDVTELATKEAVMALAELLQELRGIRDPEWQDIEAHASDALDRLRHRRFSLATLNDADDWGGAVADTIARALQLHVVADSSLPERVAEQIVLPLLANTFDAVSLRAEQEPSRRDRGRYTCDATLAPDGTLTVTVTDSGLGIPYELLTEVMEHRYTTKADALQGAKKEDYLVFGGHGRGSVWLKRAAFQVGATRIVIDTRDADGRSFRKIFRPEQAPTIRPSRRSRQGTRILVEMRLSLLNPPPDRVTLYHGTWREGRLFGMVAQRISHPPSTPTKLSKLSRERNGLRMLTWLAVGLGSASVAFGAEAEPMMRTFAAPARALLGMSIAAWLGVVGGAVGVSVAVAAVVVVRWLAHRGATSSMKSSVEMKRHGLRELAMRLAALPVMVGVLGLAVYDDHLRLIQFSLMGLTAYAVDQLTKWSVGRFLPESGYAVNGRLMQEPTVHMLTKRVGLSNVSHVKTRAYGDLNLMTGTAVVLFVWWWPCAWVSSVLLPVCGLGWAATVSMTVEAWFFGRVTDSLVISSEYRQRYMNMADLLLDMAILAVIGDLIMQIMSGRPFLPPGLIALAAGITGFSGAAPEENPPPHATPDAGDAGEGAGSGEAQREQIDHLLSRIEEVLATDPVQGQPDLYILRLHLLSAMGVLTKKTRLFYPFVGIDLFPGLFVGELWTTEKRLGVRKLRKRFFESVYPGVAASLHTHPRDPRKLLPPLQTLGAIHHARLNRLDNEIAIQQWTTQMRPSDVLLLKYHRWMESKNKWWGSQEWLGYLIDALPVGMTIVVIEDPVVNKGNVKSYLKETKRLVDQTDRLLSPAQRQRLDRIEHDPRLLGRELLLRFFKNIFHTTKTQNGHEDTKQSPREMFRAFVDFCGLCGVMGHFAKVQLLRKTIFPYEKQSFILELGGYMSVFKKPYAADLTSSGSSEKSIPLPDGMPTVPVSSVPGLTGAGADEPALKSLTEADGAV